MSKIVIGSESRDKLAIGVSILAAAVKVTLGPKGRNVFIEKEYPEEDLLTKDGVTVAINIVLDDPHEEMGARAIKRVSSDTDSKASDGTTTATVLAEAILKEGLKNVAAGANPLELKKGIDLATAVVVLGLGMASIDVNSTKMTRQVATISANNDEETGKIVAEAFGLAGKNGVVTVEDSKGFDTYAEVVTGMHFDRGFVSDYFITDIKSKSANLVNPYILMYDRKISNVEDILPLLEACKANSRPLVVIAHDITGQALATIVSNKMNGLLEIVGIKAPGHGKYRTELLEDIAVATGGSVASTPDHIKLEAPKYLGRASSVKCDRDNTTIVGGNSTDAELDARVLKIEKKIKITPEGYDKKFLKNRVAKLDGGVGIVYVGAYSPIEAKEKKDRVIDAVGAVRAALKEGVVPGGGTALVNIVTPLLKVTGTGNDLALGMRILYKACLEPIKAIADNGGYSGEVVLNTVQKKKKGYGFDAKENKYVDMIKSGIIDPAKVTRCALQSAASVSGMILTTECVILK